MGGRVTGIRILGLTSTTHGCAFVLVEGDTLIDWGVLRFPRTAEASEERILRLLAQFKPFGVVLAMGESRSTKSRAHELVEVVSTCCRQAVVLFWKVLAKVVVEAWRVKSRWELANTLATFYPEMRSKLPAKREAWQSEDDRIGIFLALGAARSVG